MKHSNYVNYINYINGTWSASRSGRFIKNVNPANGEILGYVTQSTRDEVNEAVRSAQAAQKTWKMVPAPKRGELLIKVGQLLKERKEELARVLTQEMGKVIAEARGEVQEAIDMAFYMAGEGRRLFGQTTPAELPNKHAMSIRVPVGVAGLITPWNFPIAIATWKIFPAILSGNTVVWKPATDTPAMACALASIMEEAGIPRGVVNVIHGSGQEVGMALVEHPEVNIISFTGSTEIGSDIASKAGRLLKKVSLEMGGKNAIIVMDDADLALAVEGILWSAFGTSGQRCTACSRLIVHRSVQKQLEDMILKRISQLRLGNGLDESVHVGPVINESALDRIQHYIQLGIQEGAQLLVGGSRATEGALHEGYYYQPTVFTNVTPSMQIAQEEIFGPVLSIITVDSLEEAIEVNNQVIYGLSSAIYTNNVNRAFQAMRDLESGLVYINSGTIGAEIHLPFGGMKHTGNGHRDSGIAALDVFTEWKSIYVDYSGKLQRAQIDNN